MPVAYYGSAEYGTETYGSLSTWHFEVDWDNDTVYDADEANRMVSFRSSRGRKNHISPSGNGLEPVGIGRASILLDNFDGRYSAYTTDSALYPNIEPGKFCKVWVYDGGVAYDVFTGIISDIQAEGGRDEMVRIEIEDGNRWLLERDATTALYTNIKADAAIGYVLDEVEWPTLWGRSIGAGIETIPYWYANGDKAHREIFDVADSELGTFWLDASGVATYRNRQTAVASSTDVTQGDVLANIFVPQPWEVVRNIVWVYTNSRSIPTTDTTIYTMLEKPQFSAGEVREIWASYTYSGQPVSGANVITPVSATDYGANTAQNGTGTNTTTDFTVTMTAFADTAKLTITNNGSTTSYLTSLIIRGDPIITQDKTYAIAQVNDYATKPRILKIDLPWLQDINTAQDFATFLANSLGSPRPFPVFQIEQRFVLQFGLDLFDVATLNFPKRAIDGGYMICGIDHEWISGPQQCRTTFYTEPYSDVTGYWRFTATVGITTIFGW